MPGPIRVSWSSASRDELLVGARPFHEYPDTSTGVHALDRWWLSDTERGRLWTTHPVPAVFVISRKPGGELRGQVLEDLMPPETGVAPLRVALADLPLSETEMRRVFTETLERQGLTAEETRSLVRTWEKEFFETPGLRVITLLPQWIYDALLPLEVYPVPGEMVRVGLVWLECENLEVGVEPWGLMSDAERWRTEPWSFDEEYAEISWEVFTPGPTTPLEISVAGELLHNLGRPGSLSISADGSRIAFMARDGSTQRVLLADLAEKTLGEIARVDDVSERQFGGLCLSASGERLACRVGRGESFLVDLPSMRRMRLAEFARLSGDGHRLLYSEQDREQRSLKVLDLEARKVFTVFTNDLGFGLDARDPAISLDGTKVAFTRGDVYLIDMEKETILNVSRSHGSDRAPSLSRDGRRVVFESRRTRDSDIFLSDLEARTIENLTRRPGEDRFPGITAAGRGLIYRDMDARGIFTVDLETGEKRPIPGTERAYTARMSASGNRVALLQWRGEELHLVVRDLR